MKKLLAASLLAFLSNMASANFTCDVTVKYLGLTDALYVDYGYGLHKMCDFAESKCDSWFEVLNNSKQSGTPVRIFFSDDEGSASLFNGTDSACKTVGSWGNQVNDAYFLMEF